MKNKVQAKLVVRANAESGVLVTHLEALERHITKFVGWQHDPDSTPTKPQFQADLEPTTLNPSCVAHFSDYLKSLKLGDLLPADDATADAAGVKRPVSAATLPSKALAKAAPRTDSDSKETL